MNRRIFIDRDGVINKFQPQGDIDKPETWNYILSWDEFEFEDGVFEAFRLMEQNDYHSIVISNQSCVGRKLASYRAIQEIFDKMKYVLSANGGDCIYYFCPHKPDENCACRKPKPGMIWQAAVEYEIDLSQSWIIGDSKTDIEAGAAAGIPLHNCFYVGKESNNVEIKGGESPYFPIAKFFDPGTRSPGSNTPYLKVTTVRYFKNLLEAVKYIIQGEE